MLYTERDIISKSTDERILRRLRNADSSTLILAYYGNTTEAVLNDADRDENCDELAVLNFDAEHPFGIYKTIGVDDDGRDKYGIVDYTYVIIKKKLTWIPYDLNNEEDLNIIMNSWYKRAPAISQYCDIYVKPIRIDPDGIYILNTESRIEMFTPSEFRDTFKTLEGNPAGKTIGFDD